MRLLERFENQLINAVRYAENNPTPTAKETAAIKAKLRAGLTNGQYEVVVRAYNSSIRRISYLKSKG